MSELKLPQKIQQSNINSNISSKKSFVSRIFGSDGFNFKDVLDLINPLHHIPIVGAVYRSLSNDKIAPAIKLAGGALFGGAAGAGLAAIGLIANKDKAPKSTNIANNSYHSKPKKFSANTISIDDLVAQRRLASPDLKSGTNFISASNIPSVNNYLSFVAFHQKKMMANTLQALPKRNTQISDIQRIEAKTDFMNTRIDRRL